MSWLTFSEGAWLLALLGIPVLVVLYLVANKRKKKEAIKFSHLDIVRKAAKKTSRRNQWMFYILLASIFFLVLALADPHIPLKQSKQGVNVVLALDVSGSMQATDYKPTRIDAAKASAKILLQSLEPNDDAGVVIFSSGATTAAYLSPYKDKVIQKLEDINPTQGATAIGDGLALSVDMASSIPNKKKVIILMSDGVNNAGVMTPDEAIEYAKQAGIKVYTIGLGSKKPVVLGYDWMGNPQYAQLDPATLEKIANETGGEYYKSVDTDTLKNIYKQLSQKFDREREPTSIKDWMIAISLVLMIIQLVMRYGGRRILQ